MADCSHGGMKTQVLYWFIVVALLVSAGHILITYMDPADPLAFFVLTSWQMWAVIVLLALFVTGLVLMLGKQKAIETECDVCPVTA